MPAQGRNSIFARMKKKDDAVAEIIGTILIFAIAISLFTTFILWYVPATGTANEQSYDQQTQSSFLSFANKISDYQVNQGQTSSFTIPTGIKGVPPFSPSSPTSVSFSRNLDNFSASLEFNLSVNYTPQGGSPTNYTLVFTEQGRGVFKTAAFTQFTTPTSYDLQDGLLIQTQGNSNQAVSMGPLPIALNSSSPGLPSLGSQLLNISGQSTSTSSIGSTIAVLYYSSVNSTFFKVGKLNAVNGTTGIVNSITLNSYYYNITSNYYLQWNNALYQQFNSSMATLQQSSSLSSWGFKGVPFAANLSGQKLSISLSHSANFNSVNIVYLGVTVNSL